MAFSSDQQTEIDRLDSGRILDESDPDAGGLILSKLEKYSAAQLKCRVNILGLADSVNYATENNYSSTEQGVINAVMPTTKWMIAIPVLLADAQVLRDGGMAEASILAMLRQTNR